MRCGTVRPSAVSLRGALIVLRRHASGPPVLLLHATLNTAADYDPLAARLAADFTVLAIDRRSAGASHGPPGGALDRVDMADHIADLEAVLDDGPGDDGPQAAFVVGHSFGGVVGLELAARRPDLVRGLWVFEPPYIPAGPPDVQEAFRRLPARLREVVARDGVEAAGPAFLSAISRLDMARLSDTFLTAARAEGRSALADAGLSGQLKAWPGPRPSPSPSPVAAAPTPRSPKACRADLAGADRPPRWPQPRGPGHPPGRDRVVHPDGHARLTRGERMTDGNRVAPERIREMFDTIAASTIPSTR